MKKAWLILSLIPVPFLFLFYEYNQKIKGEDPKFLLIGVIIAVFITGYLSEKTKFIFFILTSFINIVISLILAIYLIPDDATWFTPFGRNFAVFFVGIVYFIGQLIIRSSAKIANKK